MTVILDELSTILKRDKVLKLPFGTLTLVKPTPKRVFRFNKIVKINTKTKVHFKRKTDD